MPPLSQDSPPPVAPAIVAPPSWGRFLPILGLASAWLIYPLTIASLGLLRDVWSWTVLLLCALWCTWQDDPTDSLVRAFAWSVLLAALANAGQGFVQAYQLWHQVVVTDVYGYLHQRNQFATLCLLGLGASAWIHTRQYDSHLRAPAVRALALVSAVVLGAATSLSASRTGLLTLALWWLAVEVVVLRAPSNIPTQTLRTTLRLAALGYGLAVLAAWIPSLADSAPSIGILARRETQEGLQICSSRLSLWANVLELIALRPWLGWGWGELDYAHFVTEFHTERFCALLSNAHNLPLHLAVELGTPAALLACGAALWATVRAQPWQEQKPERLFAWSLLLAIGLHSLVEYPWWYGPFQISAAIAVWTLWRRPASSAGTASASHLRLLVRATLTGLLGLALLVTGDYLRASQIYLPATQRLGAYRTDTREQIRTSIWFQDLIDFADLGLTEVTPDNAPYVHALAKRMLHFSPEAMVVRKLLDSARLLGLTQEYNDYQRRFAVAYPQAFMEWKAHNPAP